MAPEHNADEIARMEGELSRLEYELQSRYRDMGKGLLEIAEQERREINRLADAIITTRKALTKARHETQCAQCATFNPPDSHYCKRCGARLPGADEDTGEHTGKHTGEHTGTHAAEQAKAPANAGTHTGPNDENEK